MTTQSAPAGWHELRPEGALGAFVECLWFGGAASTEGQVFVVEPDGRTDAVLAFDERGGHAIAFGTTSVATPFALTAGYRYLGIRLRPTRSRAFLDAHPAALRDSHRRVDRIGGLDAGQLLECAAVAPSPERALQAIAQLLAPAVAGLETRDTLASALVAYVERRGGNVRVSDLARQAGLSERQLERQFVDAVGLPPKLFCRIARYQRVRKALATGARPGADLALRFGYTDQSHLLRDVRALSGAAG